MGLVSQYGKTIVPALVAAAVMAVATPVYGFACSRVLAQGTPVGPALSWFTPRALLTYTVDTNGTDRIPGTAELDVIDEAFSTWTLQYTPDTDCSLNPPYYTDVVFTGLPVDTPRCFEGYDTQDPNNNRNLVMFCDNAWPCPPCPGTGARNEGPEDEWELALTTVTYDVVTGEILDADIEFNTAFYDFVDWQPGEELGVAADLLNTAVHEVGHFLGLAHVPKSDATMYATAPEGDLQKRDLSCDDLRGLVFKYPADGLNRYCDSPADPTCGGCVAPPDPSSDVLTLRPETGVAGFACTGVSPGGLLLCAPLVAWAAASRRRRRRRR